MATYNPYGQQSMGDCKWPELYEKWCLGNTDAAAVMGRFARLSQLADDFVDEEVKGDRSKSMVDLLHIALVELPINPFYRRFQTTYGSVIIQVLLMYHASNEWYDEDKRDVQMFSFVWREATELLINHTAYLVGGLEHAQQVVSELREHWKENDPDKLLQWSKERGGR